MAKRYFFLLVSVVSLALPASFALSISAHAQAMPLRHPAIGAAIDSSALAARREAAIEQLRARMGHHWHADETILFAEPPTDSSLSSSPDRPDLPDSLSGGMFVAVGDVDGDGLPDVVGVEWADSTLVVRRNLGGGAYGPAARYPLAVGAQSLVLADFNGDGHLDVGVANLAPMTGPPPLPHAYSTLRNRGDGTFEPRVDGSLTGPAIWVHSADIGHDGRADLVFTLYNQSSVDVVRSRADGSFEPVVNLSPVTPVNFFHYTSADVGDLDSDGNPDIVLLYNDGDCDGFGGPCLKLAVFYGRNDGTFEKAVIYQAYDPDASHGAGSVKLEHVDGDERLDIVVRVVPVGGPGPPTPTGPAVIHNAGARRLDAPFVQALALAPVAIAPAKLVREGPEDLVFSDNASVSIMRGRGDGTFGTPVNIARGALGAVTDLNGDGLSDIIVSRTDTTEIWLSDGTGRLSRATVVTAGRFLAVANFTGERREAAPESDQGHHPKDRAHSLDLAVLLPNGHIGILPGDGDGRFGSPIDFGSADGLDFPLQAADLDGDGRADFAFTGSGGGASDAIVLKWNLGGSFSAPVFLDIGSAHYPGATPFPTDIKVGDFNGDGLPDLAVVKGTGGGAFWGAVTMVLNRGQREFGPAAPNEVAGEDAYRAAVGDFDGDGSDELAIAAMATLSTGRYYIFKADGNDLHAIPDATFYGGYAVEAFATCAAVGDFNGDGRPDLAIGCGEWDYGNQPGSIVVAPNITPREVHAHRHQGARFDAQSSALASPTFEIEGVRPNPAVGGRINVSFALPTTAPAQIEVIDIAGRRVAEREVGSLGSGRHVIELAGGHHLAPGIYLVRLTQGTSVRTARVAILD